MNLVILDTINRSLYFNLDEATITTECDISVHYVDATATTLAEGAALNRSSGVTKVQVLIAPGSGINRVVNQVTVVNNDTVTHIIFLYERDTATDYVLAECSLLPGQSWDSSMIGPTVRQLQALDTDTVLKYQVFS